MGRRQSYEVLPTREKMRPRKCRKMKPADLKKNR